ERDDVMPTTVLQCEQCKTSVFAVANQRVVRRDMNDESKKFINPDDSSLMRMEDFDFQHYVTDCRGSIITIPILISKLEGKFCGQALPASPYLPKDSSF